MKTVDQGSTNVSIVLRMVDNASGSPKTDITSASTGLALWYRREGAAKVEITESDLTALTDAHSDGGMLHIADGYYRIDVPDAAFAAGATGVLVGGTASGVVVLGFYVNLRDADTEWEAIADTLLQRGMDAIEDTAGAYTLASVILKILKSAIAGGYLEWYKTDGTTQFASQQVTTTSGAYPVTAVGTPS